MKLTNKITLRTPCDIYQQAKEVMAKCNRFGKVRQIDIYIAGVRHYEGLYDKLKTQIR